MWFPDKQAAVGKFDSLIFRHQWLWSVYRKRYDDGYRYTVHGSGVHAPLCITLTNHSASFTNWMGKARFLAAQCMHHRVTQDDVTAFELKFTIIALVYSLLQNHVCNVQHIRTCIILWNLSNSC